MRMSLRSLGQVCSGVRGTEEAGRKCSLCSGCWSQDVYLTTFLREFQLVIAELATFPLCISTRASVESVIAGSSLLSPFRRGGWSHSKPKLNQVQLSSVTFPAAGMHINRINLRSSRQMSTPRPTTKFTKNTIKLGTGAFEPEQRPPTLSYSWHPSAECSGWGRCIFSASGRTINQITSTSKISYPLPWGEHRNVHQSHFPKSWSPPPRCQHQTQLLPGLGCCSKRRLWGWMIPVQQYQICLLVLLRAVSEKGNVACVEMGARWKRRDPTVPVHPSAPLPTWWNTEQHNSRFTTWNSVTSWVSSVHSPVIQVRVGQVRSVKKWPWLPPGSSEA